MKGTIRSTAPPTRRAALALVAAVATIGLLAAACGHPDGGAVPRNGLLYVNTGSGLTAVDPIGSQVTFRADGAIAAPNWSRLYRASDFGGATRLTTLDAVTGTETDHEDVPGAGLTVRAISGDGRTVALGPPPPAAGYLPIGRMSTTLVVAEPGKNTSHRYEMPGNLAPEAFSQDGKTIFVIDYTPAQAPVDYQVRRFDIASGEVHDVYSKDDDLQEPMGGTARTQVRSPDGKRLYTLYSQHDEEGRRAFVHVLDLDKKWAHCVDLPADFVDAADGAGALALSPDGHHLYVMVATTKALAEIDTATLRVTRSTHVDVSDPYATAATPPHAALGVDGTGRVLFGLGPRLATLDRTDFRVGPAWTMSGPIVGIEPAAIGPRVSVATADTLAVVDTTTGKWLSQITLIGATGLARSGGAPTPQVPDRGGLSCAC